MLQLVDYNYLGVKYAAGPQRVYDPGLWTYETRNPGPWTYQGVSSQYLNLENQKSADPCND